ncbi:low molecular weight phosphotyrosine protein phosphatase-like isoform X2 [Liolophura sinensis]
MAEGIFNHILKERGLQDKWLVDSAATSTYQIGNPPDDRAIAVMKKHGLSMDHTARQITAEDFTKFKYIFGMDKENIQDLKRVKPKGSPSEILLLGKYDPRGKSDIIEDPYFESGMKPFETVYEQCTSKL